MSYGVTLICLRRSIGISRQTYKGLFGKAIIVQGLFGKFLVSLVCVLYIAIVAGCKV